MALRTLLESLDDVPEELRKEYVEQDVKTSDGKTVKRFVLQLDNVDAHPLVRNRKTAHDATKREKTTLKEQLDSVTSRLEGLPEDFSAEVYADLKRRAEGKKVDETELVRLREDLQKKHQRELDAKDQIIQKRERQLDRVISTELTNALVEAGVGPEFLEATTALLRPKIAREEDPDTGDIVVVAKTDIGSQPLKDFAKSWTSSEQGKIFVPKASGGGADGGGGTKSAGVNPWHKDTRNLTEQNALIMANPAKARSLAKAAGVSDAEIARWASPTQPPNSGSHATAT